METVASEQERRQMESYRRELEAILKIYRPPDCSIYLRVTLAAQKARMAERNREAEFLIGEAFYRSLNAKYEEYFGASGRFQATATIDTDALTLAQVEERVLRVVGS
jgi:deoxyadenosine/deoxycytidine kinase